MKTMRIMLALISLAGCAQRPVSIDPRTATGESQKTVVITKMLGAQPAVVNPPTIVRHWGFKDEGGNWPTFDTWTNYWTFAGVLVSTNLNLPVAQWIPWPATLEVREGHLGFTTESAEPVLFVWAMFQPK